MLAGGASRRLAGTPKGLEKIGDSRIVDRVATALRALTSDLVLVANDPEAASWLPGVAVMSDLHPGAGGMAGIEAGLSGGRDALIVAWDMPFVTPPLLRALLQAAEANHADVVVPESDSPYGFEPFCAFYAARVLPSLTAFLASGGGAARDFVKRVSRLHRIAIADVERIGDPRRLFFSVNTPDDLARARSMADAK